MARLAWFKQERKPRTTERIRLEIPADAWEKCDECGHIDIKDRFARAFNVCPNCGHHRRIPAQDYSDLRVDEGSWHELDARLRREPLEMRLGMHEHAAAPVQAQPRPRIARQQQIDSLVAQVHARRPATQQVLVAKMRALVIEAGPQGHAAGAPSERRSLR